MARVVPLRRRPVVCARDNDGGEGLVILDKLGLVHERALKSNLRDGDVSEIGESSSAKITTASPKLGDPSKDITAWPHRD